jgi:nucleotide-binding universal stress UspA family protein
VRRLSARERFLIIVAGAALIGFVLAFGVIVPMARRAAELARNEAEYREVIAEADSMYRAVPTIEAEVADLRSETAQLMFPREEAKIAIVHEIDKLAAEAGVRLTRVTPPGDPEPAAGCLKYSASFRADSSFAEAIDLLYKLERPDRRLWVEGVEIISARGAGDELQVNVQLAVYVPIEAGEEDDAEA